MNSEIGNCRCLWIAPLVALGLAHPTAAQRAHHQTRALDSYIATALRQWHVAGLSIAVVRNDSVVYIRGFGVRDVGKPGAVDENTVFAIGSNTKLFTAVAAGMLVDSGLMHWDDRVTTFLPAFQLNDPWVTREVTIRDLLSHRTGLGAQAGNMLAYGSGLSRREVIDRLRFLPPASSFRSTFAYQNLGVLAAGEAAAAASGRSWDSLVTSEILARLSMYRTHTSVRDVLHMDNVATPHSNASGTLTPLPWRDIDNIGPAGSITSSASDMANWLRFLLADGRRAGTQLLGRETLAEIESPQTIVKCPVDSLRPSIHFCAYGLGVLMNDYRGLKVLSHTGGIDGMLSSVTLVPERHLGIVVLTNTDGHNALFVAISRYVLDLNLGQHPRDWSALLLADADRMDNALRAYARRIESQKVPPINNATMTSYTGSYDSALYGSAVVEARRGGLILRLRGGRTADLTPWAFDTYRVVWRDIGDAAELPDSFVSFRRTATGTVDALVIRDDVTRPPDMGMWNADVFQRVAAPN